MKFSPFVLLLSFGFEYAVALLEPVIENVVHLQTALPPPDVPGLWRKKLIWKARWVQEWKSSKSYRPVWRKVWSPVEIREWVPVPRPPPTEPPVLDHPPPNDISSYPPVPPNPPIGQPVQPDRPPPFRPIPGPANKPSTPPNKYGPPSSTALHPVPDNLSDGWPTPDTQTLLTSYRTIRDPDAYNEQEKPDLPEFFEPPKQDDLIEFRKEEKKVSPYAAKLAEAVIREKLKQKGSERPSGLTDIVYKSLDGSTTPASLKSSTESPSNVYIVTPVSFS